MVCKYFVKNHKAKHIIIRRFWNYFGDF